MLNDRHTELWSVMFGFSSFRSRNSSSRLWQSVDVLPENLSTDVITWLQQLKTKTFLWMKNKNVYFILQLAQICWMGLTPESSSPSFTVCCIRKTTEIFWWWFHSMVYRAWWHNDDFVDISYFIRSLGIWTDNSSKQLKPAERCKCSNNFGNHCVTTFHFYLMTFSTIMLLFFFFKRFNSLFFFLITSPVKVRSKKLKHRL